MQKGFSILKMLVARCLYKLRLSVVSLSFIVVGVVVLILYGYTTIYHEELQDDSEQVNVIQSPYTKTFNSDDKTQETNQKVTSPTNDVQVNSKQDKPNKKTNQKMTTEYVQVNSKQGKTNKETNQKITSLVEQVQVKPKQEKPKERTNQVKLFNQPVNMKKPQTKKQDYGINFTDINRMLIEPIHVSYNRNIYFTVKTTNKNYIKRLLPQMLTWYQVVDKNKVRHC